MRLIDADDFKQRVIKVMKCVPLLYASETRQEYFDEILNRQPTIEVSQWIPCSERLPEDLNDKNIDCFLVTDGFLIWMAYYNSEIGWQFAECTNSRNKIDWTEIIAWQPLPEPYEVPNESR